MEERGVPKASIDFSGYWCHRLTQDDARPDGRRSDGRSGEARDVLIAAGRGCLSANIPDRHRSVCGGGGGEERQTVSGAVRFRPVPDGGCPPVSKVRQRGEQGRSGTAS
ncbi:hypothetical protein [Kitasatospora aureofaciens]|uniref:hypothetical protein n=1 Tax=Kitasatospora aureofaciens TaxID=1894 RepID=UPI0037F45A5B